MKIKRNVNGQEIEFVLTFEEQMVSYYEWQNEIDKEDVQNVLDEMGLTATDEQLELIADKFRDYMSEDDSWRYRFWKPSLQKRLRTGTDCCGKHLGCRNWTGKGLQYGLSGNRVLKLATLERVGQTGTACAATTGPVR